MRRIAPFLALSAAMGCRAHRVFDEPIFDDGTFARGTPTAEELERFEAAAAYSTEKDGRAMMVRLGDGSRSWTDNEFLDTLLVTGAK